MQWVVIKNTLISEIDYEVSRGKPPKCARKRFQNPFISTNLALLHLVLYDIFIKRIWCKEELRKVRIHLTFSTNKT